MYIFLHNGSKPGTSTEFEMLVDSLLLALKSLDLKESSGLKIWF